MGMGYMNDNGKKSKLMVDGERRRSEKEGSMYHVKVIDAHGRGKGKRDKMLVGDGDLDLSFLVQGTTADHTSLASQAEPTWSLEGS